MLTDSWQLFSDRHINDPPAADFCHHRHHARLVLGIGNPLMADDGVGLHLLKMMTELPKNYDPELVEFLDGGTQGIALLGRIASRKAVVFLDAIALKDKPGTIHILTKEELISFNSSKTPTAHEGSASDILKIACLSGDVPEKVICIGIEPKRLEIDIGLTDEMLDAMPEAVATTKREIDRFLKEI